MAVVKEYRDDEGRRTCGVCHHVLRPTSSGRRCGCDEKRTRIPDMRRIGRGELTERLYAAETTNTEALGAAARRLEEVLVEAGLLTDPVDHYRDVRPEAIFTLLESQDTQAALAACFGFIAWYRINRPGQFKDALLNWRAQRGPECPTCSLQMTHWRGLDK